MVNVNIYVNKPLTFQCIYHGDAFLKKNEEEYLAFVKLDKDVEEYDQETRTWNVRYNAVSFEGELEYFEPCDEVIPAKANITVHPATISTV
jgi:hypothetical protein